MNYYNTEEKDCQDFVKHEEKILTKLAIKKSQNAKIIDFLHSENDHERANRVEECGTFLGITNVEGQAKIIKSNFCRERICAVCAWRRQSKFVAQMLPVINYLSNDYEFIFVTLTIANMCYDELRNAIDNLLTGYQKLVKRRAYKRSWKGVCRSLELTYNAKSKTFHPHIHCLIAVKSNYFSGSNEDYISHERLKYDWQDVMNLDYEPVVDIKKVVEEDNYNATIETLKYALKPTYEIEALKSFLYILKGRRLVSFTGVFAKTRKLFKYTDFELKLNDDIDNKKVGNKEYNLYKFDITGGVYSFYKRLELIY